MFHSRGLEPAVNLISVSRTGTSLPANPSTAQSDPQNTALVRGNGTPQEQLEGRVGDLGLQKSIPFQFLQKLPA